MHEWAWWLSRTETHIIYAGDRRPDHETRPHSHVDDRTPPAVEISLRAGAHGQEASPESRPSKGLMGPVVRQKGQAYASVQAGEACQGHASHGPCSWWRHPGLVKLRHLPCSSPSGQMPRFSVHWEQTAAVEERPRM